MPRITMTSKIKTLEKRAKDKERRYKRIGVSIHAPLRNDIPGTIRDRRQYIAELESFNKRRNRIVLESGEEAPYKMLALANALTNKRNRERALKRKELNALVIDAPKIEERWRLTAKMLGSREGVSILTSRPGGLNNDLMPVSMQKLPKSIRALERRIKIASQQNVISSLTERNRNNLAQMYATAGRYDVASKILRASDKAIDIAVYRLGIFDNIRPFIASPVNGELDEPWIDSISGHDSIGEREMEWLTVLEDV